jgi:ABC-type bacteriocin/lantibiotic exporter with double-glycine peptidase domain
MLGRGGVRSSIMESRVKYEVANQLQELTRAPIAYRVEGGRDLALDRTDVLVRKYLRARTDHFRVVFRQTAFALGFQAIASAALLGLGGWLVMEGQLTLGQLVAAELIVATIAGSFTKLGKQLEDWYDLMAAVDKLGHLVDLPLERHDGEAFHTGRSPLGLSVELLHVGYGYGHGHDILSDVSLTIPAGGKLAVVGPSGSGKSTLSEILYGLRSVSRGRIEIDGVNLRDLSLTRLRESIALVQDVEIIDGTILENVRLGRNAMRSDTIREALESVGLWDELSHLPEGMHTRLSSSGSPLSRGQARRLMLARALAGAPRLLILDEALDRLDLDSRGLVIETLFKTNPAFTLILITHDEEMARLCDRVVVLAEGRATPKKLDAGQPDLGRWLMEMRECRSA